jgi:menaquinone-dependent protoporphyrinogen oxidase
MRVLVSVASKHGATDEIGHRIAATIEGAGQTVISVAPEAVVSIDGYDAVVLGSGVYAGRWLETAKSFVERNREALATKRVWLFSSGPIGDPPKPVEEPADAALMVAATAAIEHRTFAGRVEKKSLGFGEKLIMTALRAPEGDFRPWDDIDAWAWSIAKALKAEPVAV